MSEDTQPAKSTMPDPTSRTSLEARVEALESRVAFQEDWLDTLDGRVREQTVELDRLNRLTALMRERLREQRQTLEALGGEAAHDDDERPPHY